MFSVPLGLLGVEAQDIAFSHLAVADDHLFDLQVVFDQSQSAPTSAPGCPKTTGDPHHRQQTKARYSLPRDKT